MAFNPHDPATMDIRKGGSPGVRVRSDGSGVTQRTRAPSIPNVGAVRTVPIETLGKVRELLTSDTTVRPAGVVLREVLDLLEPWL